MAGKLENIDNRAKEILREKKYRSGIKAGELCELLATDKKLINMSGTRPNIGTIKTRVSALKKNYPQEVYSPEWGLIRHISHKIEEEREEPEEKTGIPEEEFYQPFADWLVNELGECTEAYKLGRNILRDKWGTPDVIGIRKPESGSVLPSAIELTTAEIKIEATPSQLLPAFGQASAYKLFSHRVYLVVPRIAKNDVLIRIERLCMINGIGLILFDSTRKKKPGFEVKIRGTRLEPDYFYLGKFAREISEIDGFEKLFLT